MDSLLKAISAVGNPFFPLFFCILFLERKKCIKARSLGTFLAEFCDFTTQAVHVGQSATMHARIHNDQIHTWLCTLPINSGERI